MIFSEANWNYAAEIKPFVNVTAAVTFETMEAPLSNAYRLYLVPLFGDTLITRLETIYKKADATDVEKNFLQLCQRANANLALWYDFDELSIQITDSGFSRNETDSMKTLYRYKERNLKEAYQNKGMNALDEALAFLETHTGTGDFPEFKQADSYTLLHNAIVPNATTVNKFYNINNSRLIFLLLQSHLNIVEQSIIAVRLATLYDGLSIELAKDVPDEKYITLRNKIQPVMVLLAVNRFLKNTGSLTDRGLYFDSAGLTRENDQLLAPVSDERLDLQIDQTETDAKTYMNLLDKYVQATFPDQYVGKSGTVLQRDNDRKSSIWL